MVGSCVRNEAKPSKNAYEEKNYRLKSYGSFRRELINRLFCIPLSIAFCVLSRPPESASSVESPLLAADEDVFEVIGELVREDRF
jgi:hypothetical protein